MKGMIASPTSNVPNKSSSKRTIIIIVIAVILVGLGLAVWMRLSNSQSGDQSNAELLGDTYNSPEHGISLRFPKGWTEAATSKKTTPYIVVKYQNPQPDSEGSVSGHASIDLNIQPIEETLDDHARHYIEAAINFNVQSQILEHKDTVVNGQPARLLSYEIPNKDGIKGRITQYTFVNDHKFYDLTFGALASKWPTYQAAFDATLNSVTWE